MTHLSLPPDDALILRLRLLPPPAPRNHHEQRQTRQWLASFRALCALQHTGAPGWPILEPGHPGGLGRWTRIQLDQTTAGTIPPWRRLYLHSLNGWPRHLCLGDHQWLALYFELLFSPRFPGWPNLHTHTPVLGSWVRFQRKLYAQGRLARWKILQLEALDGWLWRVPSSISKSRGRDPARYRNRRILQQFKT